MPNKNDILTRSYFELTDVETRATDDGKKVISGYAARFDSLSVPMWGFREKIRYGAFRESLKRNDVKALWNHNSDKVLGSTKAKTLTLAEDEKGLRFEIYPPDTTDGNNAYESIRRGDVSGVSFGFKVEKQEWDESDENNVIRTLVQVDLREISPTPFPAYQDTSASVRSVTQDYDEYKAEKDKREKEINENNLILMLRKVEAL